MTIQSVLNQNQGKIGKNRRLFSKATFAAGCFWTPELKFSKLKGVKETKVGYTDGKTKNPNYEQVCSDTTQHAEAVEVTFDEKEISYSQLLKEFWKMHDPTQMNKQGPDIGSQYRSAIFYHNDEQKQQAQESLKKEQKNHKEKIVTQISEASEFYPAEEYHQDYLAKQGKTTC